MTHEDELLSSLAAVLGRFRLDGSIEITRPGGRTGVFIDSTLVHENAHWYLFTSALFGQVQRVAYQLSVSPEMPPAAARLLHERLLLLNRQSLVLHEGAATFAKHHWIRAHRDKGVADAYVRRKPNVYRRGMAIFQQAIGDWHHEVLDRSSFALVLAEAALATNIWAHNLRSD